MLKARNKKLSMILILAMVMTMFAGLGTASASSTYTVVKAPTVQVSTTPQALGKIQIDIPEISALSVGDVLSFNLPAGVTASLIDPAAPLVPLVSLFDLASVDPTAAIVVDDTIQLDKSAGLSPEMSPFTFACSSLGNRTFNLTITGIAGSPNGAGRLMVSFNNMVLSSAGDVNLVVASSAGSGFSGPAVLKIASSSSNGSVYAAINGINSLDSSGGAIQAISIAENSTNSMSVGDVVTVKLPRGFTWNSVLGAMGDWAFASGAGTATAVINAADARKLDLTVTSVPGAATNGGRFLIMSPTITVDDSLAKEGNIECTVSSNQLDVTTSSLVVATYGETGVTIAEDSPVADVLAGADNVTVGNIKVSEDFIGSIVNGRNFKITLPTGVKWNLTGGLTDFPTYKAVSGDGISWGAFQDVSTDSQAVRVAATSKSTVNPSVFKWTNLAVDVSPAFRGDIIAEVAGTQGYTAKVKLGTVIAPVEFKAATAATQVNIGSSNQALPDLTITEAAKEAIDSASPTEYIVLTLPAAVTFTSTPTVTVTSGDLVVDTNNITKSNTDGAIYRGVLTIPTKTVSTTPSTITISNIKVTVDRTVPEGDFNVSISKASTALDLNSRFTYDNIATAQVATCVTPAPSGGTTGSITGQFKINSNIYEVDGVAKVMDAAPYIKNGRTYVPLRYLGLALGVADKDIVWDATAQTATLTLGSTVEVFTIGSTTYTVNGAAKTMDVAPEINNGRTMLPARYVAEGLGYVVGWDASTGTVLVSK